MFMVDIVCMKKIKVFPSWTSLLKSCSICKTKKRYACLDWSVAKNIGFMTQDITLETIKHTSNESDYSVGIS